MDAPPGGRGRSRPDLFLAILFALLQRGDLRLEVFVLLLHEQYIRLQPPEVLRVVPRLRDQGGSTPDRLAVDR